MDCCGSQGSFGKGSPVHSVPNSAKATPNTYHCAVATMGVEYAGNITTALPVRSILDFIISCQFELGGLGLKSFSSGQF